MGLFDTGSDICTLHLDKHFSKINWTSLYIFEIKLILIPYESPPFEYKFFAQVILTHISVAIKI